jgi:hypothetical protein
LKMRMRLFNLDTEPARNAPQFQDPEGYQWNQEQNLTS